MIDIGVSMRAEVLEHKRRDGLRRNSRYCFWSMRVPQGVGSGSKLWVASMGSWLGYFVVHVATPEELRFYSESWHAADLRTLAIPRRPFRGFTYNVPEVDHP